MIRLSDPFSKDEISFESSRRLNDVQRSWLGTRYMAGQQAKGAGVDCVRLVTGILDELYGVDGTSDLPPLPRDAGMHDARAGYRVVRHIRESYPSKLVESGSVLPGDVIVTAAEFGTPADLSNHVAMVGITGAVIHAVDPRVAFTSIQSLPAIATVYRPMETDRWR